MRIIGGEYRSRLISMPKGVEIRPTQDRVRESVFNLLGDVSGRSCLDLFAGSGAYGIEAMSRGAAYVTFVENNFKCSQTIRENLESLDINESQYNIIKTNALSVMPRLAKEDIKYDLVFMDPPYYKDMARKCLINIDSYDILSHIALIVVEHFKRDKLTLDLNTLILHKERQYSDTIISIFKKVI